MSIQTKSSPPQAPQYTPHREVTAADVADFTDVKHGLNCKGEEWAHFQVVPHPNLNPDAELLWWSQAAGKFISDQSSDYTFTGKGDGVPYEFSAPVRGRIVLVKITGVFVAGETAVVYASAFDPVLR